MDSSSELIIDKKEDILDAQKKHEPTKYRVGNIFKMIIVHSLTLYTLVFKLHQIKMWTLLYTVFLVHLATFGSTAGAHRLWTHRAYKAKLPLRILLTFGLALAGHVSAYVWARVHRLHHKYTDTDADPHNSKRGFWFSHIGWLLVDKSPEVREKEKEIDISDVMADPVATFLDRWFFQIAIILFFLPSLIPVYVWGEDLYLSILATGVLRLTWVFHNIASINSIAHMFGSRPYDKRIRPTESAFVALLAMGEGWHNYHHTFPWDYKATEFGGRLDWTARILEVFAQIGWAYDLRTASPQVVAWTKGKYGNNTLNNGNNKEFKQQE